ncbi:MAG: molybdopterin-dependent oxidoreductase [Vicinamibacterales bacterium]|nr:molybdopterin-dependent oxidoreductase [Vicinamibacterales bacterium]
MLADSERIVQGRDVWVPSVCAGCYNCCGVLVHRVDGRIVEVKGDPNAANSHGYLCAKGIVRALDVHHPSRVTKPLKRTNPEKGIGVDPKWQEISWDEAMDITVRELTKVRDKDPRGLILSHFDIAGYRLSGAFGRAFGTVNMHWNRADFCGSASHPAWLITNGTLNSEVDFPNCKYVVLWGTQLGHMVNTIALPASAELADGRRRGHKLVVVDPFCSNAASKADEWLPIKPGTDGALALAMLHVMVNELGMVDVPFLKTQTNGPYLVKGDGHYLRDEATGKPLIWDAQYQIAKTFDAVDLADPAIEGAFVVAGEAVKPSFQVLKDHLATIDVGRMSAICTIPADQIRRVTRDFCDAASIGATIEVDGHTLPLRPAGIDYKRGAAAHKGGLNSCFAIHMLNLLVGAVDVPGGQRGVNPLGPYWSPGISSDGLIIPSDFIAKYNKPYPGRKAGVPQTLDLQELFPIALFTRGLYPLGIDEPEKYGIPYRAQAMIHGRTNHMMNSHDPVAMAETLKKLTFQLSLVQFIDETAEFADVILPDAHEFERWDMFPANDPYAFIAPGPGDWYFLFRQPVAEPPGQAKPWTEIYLEIAERMGFLEAVYALGNTMWNIAEAYALDPTRKYTVRELAERQAKTIFGGTFSLDSVTETSSTILRAKTIQEAYPRMFLPSRIPIYLEYLLDHKRDVQVVLDQLHLDWDLSCYSPVPTWIPCEAHGEHGEYDLIATNNKVPTHQFSTTTENMWIDEVARANPYTYNVMLHTAAAEKRGLRTNDLVCVESRYGKYVGRLRVTELVHPETVNCSGSFGHWAKGLPVSRNKGVMHNTLVPKPIPARIDILTGQIDQCVAVKIYKVEE